MSGSVLQLRNSRARDAAGALTAKAMAARLLSSVAVLALVACNGSGGPNTEAEPKPANIFEVPEDREEFVELDSGVERFTRLSAVKDLPSRVAMAPATWVSKDGKKIPEEDLEKSFRYADILSQQLENAFVSTPYRVVSPLAVIDKMAAIGINPRNRISDEDAARLARELGVGAVLRPEITVSEVNVIFAGEISGKVSLDMIDEKGTRLVGLKHEVARGDGTIPLTIVEAVIAAVSANSMFNDRNRLVTVFELAHDLAEAMPTPANIEDSKVIRGITHTAIGRPARRGEIVWFAAQTERKADIYAKLDGDTRVRLDSEAQSLNCRRDSDSDFLDTLKALEERTGKPVYFGCYAISAQDNFTNKAITYEGWDEFGNPVDYTDYANLFTVDAEAPDSPSRMNAVYTEDSFKLNWPGVTATDVIGYRIYTSDTPRSGFEVLTDTEFERHEVPADFKGERYFRVTAIDRAGNESKPSPNARAVKVEPGPTKVAAGDIRVPTEWFAAASPYILEGDVRVARGAKLIIDPGTRIQVAPGARLIVEGGLEARGLSDSPIEWSAGGDEPWGGVEVKLRADVTMEHNVISGAATGLAIIDADPTIKHNQFSRNGTGVLMKDFANPVFAENVVRQNDVGIKLVQVAASVNDSAITANTVGIHAEEAGALIIGNDLSGNKLAIRSTTQGANTPPFADDDLWGINDLDLIKKELIEGPVIISNIREADSRRAAAMTAQLAAATAAQQQPKEDDENAAGTALAAAAGAAAGTAAGTALAAGGADGPDAGGPGGDAPGVDNKAEKPESQPSETAANKPGEGEGLTGNTEQPSTDPAEEAPVDVQSLPPAEQLKYAYTLMRKNDYQGAQDILEPLAEKAPRNADLHSRLATLRYQNSNLDGAIQSITQAISVNPFVHHYLMTAAKLQIEKKNYTAANDLLKKAEKLKPDDPNVKVLLRITALRTSGNTGG